VSQRDKERGSGREIEREGEGGRREGGECEREGVME